MQFSPTRPEIVTVATIQKNEGQIGHLIFLSVLKIGLVYTSWDNWSSRTVTSERKYRSKTYRSSGRL